MKREDIHRTSQVLPADYEFVAFECMKIQGFGDCAVVLAERERLRAHMAKTGDTYSHHEHGGSCHICGAHAVYTVLFHHQKTRTYIRTGQICAQKMEMSYGDFNAFRRGIRDAREAHAGKKKALALLTDAGLERAWDVFLVPYPKHEVGCPVQYNDWQEEVGTCACSAEKLRAEFNRSEETTIRDIVGKLVKWGSVSEKQTGYLKTLLKRIDERPERERLKAEELAKAAPCPRGRVVITGKVLGLKVVDGFNGEPATKILVQDETGFKVYGSRFANVDRGAEVKFRATVTPSDKDEKFGFFKRPVAV